MDTHIQRNHECPQKMSTMLKLVHVTTETISKRSMDAHTDNADLYAALEEIEIYDKNWFTALREDLEEDEEEPQGEQGDDPKK